MTPSKQPADTTEAVAPNVAPSKSQRKRAAHASVDLGKRLTALGAQQLADLDLPEPLAEAVAQAQRMRPSGARKRQLQYIGKLLRGMDTTELQDQLSQQTHQQHQAQAQFHQLEDWRDRLLAEGDVVVSELVQHWPQCDVQHLRQLVRKARQERLANQTPRAARALFRYLRELMADAG